MHTTELSLMASLFRLSTKESCVLLELYLYQDHNDNNDIRIRGKQNEPQIVLQ